MSTCSPSPAVICAENIALLYLLHSVPVSPSRNEINEPRFRHRSYTLSFTEERNIASTLAFLCNTTGNPNHVPALCVEENSDLASLNVMLAVNRAKWEDGKEVLQNMKQNLDKIFKILSEISEGEAIDSLKQVNQQTLHHLPVRLFTERAKDVIRLADSWAKHRKPAELEDLMEGIYRLNQIENIQALLDSIPNRDMCPSSRKSLVNIVSKVSRYREAARFLYRTARIIPSLRRMKVVLINLPKNAFNRVSHQNHSPNLASTIARSSTIGQRPDVSYLCRLLKTSGSQLNDQFAAQTRKTLREAKIHAEIQLVLHYELNPSNLPPRVVCSSKDACFLCNAFILMHGKMHTPRHHGRLYPGWRLPLIFNLNDLDLRFNLTLQDQIKDSLKVLLSRQKKTIYPDPNESTLLTLQLSASTLRTAALVEATEREEASANNSLADGTARRWEIAISPKDRASLSSSKDIESISSVLGSRRTVTVEEDGVPEMDLSDQHATQISSRCSPQIIGNKITTSDTAELIQGVPQISSIVIAREPQFHTAGALELHIEHTAGTASGAIRNNTEIVYSIEWLSVEKAKELLSHKAATIVDVEALQCQISHELNCHGDIFIMARGAVVRITPRPCGR
ncbi:hypothetical protein N0V90_013206 [Kalmusia sp. IMI 367209]|nr:hypothetical protein N0V90_013206 [Kalmusia sp. IMI 367209]